VGQLLLQANFNLRLDPVLFDLGLEDISEYEGYEALSLATCLIPVQLKPYAGYYYVSSAVYQLDSLDDGYESTIVVKRSQAVNRKLKNSFGWFLRNRLRWKIDRDWVVIHIRQEKEFGVKSHFLAHQELVKYLDVVPTKFKTQWKLDWMNYQLEASDAGFLGPMPSYQPMARTSTPMKF